MAAGGSSPAAQTRQLSQVMRAKLDYSKDLLEALVTSDWQQLDRASRSMAKTADDPAWRVLTMPEYIRQSDAFLRATDDLIDAAARRDLEAASLGYVSLTTSCVACHRYVARSRIAR
jgi:hypothetical protein